MWVQRTPHVQLEHSVLRGRGKQTLTSMDVTITNNLTKQHDDKCFIVSTQCLHTKNTTTTTASITTQTSHHRHSHPSAAVFAAMKGKLSNEFPRQAGSPSDELLPTTACSRQIEFVRLVCRFHCVILSHRATNTEPVFFHVIQTGSLFVDSIPCYLFDDASLPRCMRIAFCVCVPTSIAASIICKVERLLHAAPTISLTRTAHNHPGEEAALLMFIGYPTSMFEGPRHGESV